MNIRKLAFILSFVGIHLLDVLVSEPSLDELLVHLRRRVAE